MRAALLLALWASPAQAVPPSIADPGFLDQFTATYRFRLGRPTAVQLSPDGDAVFFLRSGPRSFERALFVFDPAKGETRRLLEAADLLGGATETLSAEEKARRERLRLSARGIARYSVSHDGRHLLFPLSGRHYLYSRADGAVKPVGPEGTTDARLSPDAARLAFVKDGDVYVEQVADGAQIRLTTRPGEHVEHGLAEFVAQEEMGRFAGMWWGPDSDRLLYQRTDVSALERFHIGDPLDPAKAPHPWPYPRPGKANAVVTLSLATLGGETVPVTWDQAAFPYLAQVKWEVGAPLTLAVQDRRQTELRLLTVDLATGATRSLLSETDAAWVEIRRAVPHWLPEGGGFLWISEASGAPQLELRDAAGARVRALSGPPGGVRGLVQVDAERRLAWVSGGPNPTQQHLYRVSLDGGPAEVVTTGAGYHGVSAARRAPLAVDAHYPEAGPATWSVQRLPPRGALAKAVGVLESKAESPSFAAKPEWVEVPGEEGRTHHAMVLRPRNFDPKYRYPVLVSVYGGPGVNMVRRVGGWLTFEQWLADHGFIVVRADGRGTPGRGRAWSRAIKGDLISAPLADQIAALEALGARFPELDLSRVGIHGWSFGGYFSAMAVMRRPDVFHAAVAGAPVTDWRDYDTHYTERFLGLPEPDKAAYDRSSVLTYAKDLTRPLLIVHGTGDDNVYFLHALKMSDALFRAGRPHDFLPLSGFTHMVSDAEVSRRLHGRILHHFTTHLGRPQAR